MELISPLPLRSDQTCMLKQVEMLRDALPRDADLVLHQQPCAELKESLPIALAQFVQNRSAHRCYDCFEDVAHL
jgi:hypothetical protein